MLLSCVQRRTLWCVARHNLGLFFAFVAICFVFSGAVLFSVARGKSDSAQAHLAASSFYALLQKRDFDGARAMLSRERQGVLSDAILAKTWDRFERKHGTLTRWELAHTPTIYGNRVSIFPRYVEESRLLSGTKGNPGAGMLQLQPEDGIWKVTRISIVP